MIQKSVLIVFAIALIALSITSILFRNNISGWIESIRDRNPMLKAVNPFIPFYSRKASNVIYIIIGCCALFLAIFLFVFVFCGEYTSDF